MGNNINQCHWFMDLKIFFSYDNLRALQQKLFQRRITGTIHRPINELSYFVIAVLL